MAEGRTDGQMRIIYEENDYTMSLIQAELDMLESGIYPGFVFFLGGGESPPLKKLDRNYILFTIYYSHQQSLLLTVQTTELPRHPF